MKSLGAKFHCTGVDGLWEVVTRSRFSKFKQKDTLKNLTLKNWKDDLNFGKKKFLPIALRNASGPMGVKRERVEKRG